MGLQGVFDLNTGLRAMPRQCTTPPTGISQRHIEVIDTDQRSFDDLAGSQSHGNGPGRRARQWRPEPGDCSRRDDVVLQSLGIQACADPGKVPFEGMTLTAMY